MAGEGKTPWFVLHSPELGGPFQEFRRACEEKGILDRKTKKLLAVAVASAIHCPSYMDEAVHQALQAGVSRDEITETLLTSSAVAAMAQLFGKKGFDSPFTAG